MLAAFYEKTGTALQVLRNIPVAFHIVCNLSPAARQQAQAMLNGFLGRYAVVYNGALGVPLHEIVRAHEVAGQGPFTGKVVEQIP